MVGALEACRHLRGAPGRALFHVPGPVPARGERVFPAGRALPGGRPRKMDVTGVSSAAEAALIAGSDGVSNPRTSSREAPRSHAGRQGRRRRRSNIPVA